MILSNNTLASEGYSMNCKKALQIILVVGSLLTMNRNCWAFGRYTTAELKAHLALFKNSAADYPCTSQLIAAVCLERPKKAKPTDIYAVSDKKLESCAECREVLSYIVRMEEIRKIVEHHTESEPYIGTQQQKVTNFLRKEEYRRFGKELQHYIDEYV